MMNRNTPKDGGDNSGQIFGTDDGMLMVELDADDASDLENIKSHLSNDFQLKKGIVIRSELDVDNIAYRGRMMDIDSLVGKQEDVDQKDNVITASDLDQLIIDHEWLERTAAIKMQYNKDDNMEEEADNDINEGSKEQSHLFSNGSNHICDQCYEVFSLAVELRNHYQQEHGSDRPFKCEVCPKAFRTPHEQKIHHELHVNGKQYKCEHCDKMFKDDTLLRVHRRLHTDTPPFICAECGRQFNSMAQMKSHSWHHTGKKLYQCQQCGNRFTEAASLRRHWRIHANYKPFTCMVCGKSFVESGALKKHERIHTGETPYSCDVCGRRFRHQGGLISHKYTHTQERDFACDQCGKKFTMMRYLKSHKRTHSGERPFVCEICGKAYLSAGSLKTHRLTHSANADEFECEKCSKLFYSMNTLRQHAKTHDEVMITNVMPAINRTGMVSSACTSTDVVALTGTNATFTAPVKNYICNHCGQMFRDKKVAESHLPTHIIETKPCSKSLKLTDALGSSVLKHAVITSNTSEASQQQQLIAATLATQAIQLPPGVLLADKRNNQIILPVSVKPGQIIVQQNDQIVMHPQSSAQIVVQQPTGNKASSAPLTLQPTFIRDSNTEVTMQNTAVNEHSTLQPTSDNCSDSTQITLQDSTRHNITVVALPSQSSTHDATMNTGESSSLVVTDVDNDVTSFMDSEELIGEGAIQTDDLLHADNINSDNIVNEVDSADSNAGSNDNALYIQHHSSADLLLKQDDIGNLVYELPRL